MNEDKVFMGEQLAAGGIHPQEDGTVAVVDNLDKPEEPKLSSDEIEKMLKRFKKTRNDKYNNFPGKHTTVRINSRNGNERYYRNYSPPKYSEVEIDLKDYMEFPYSNDYFDGQKARNSLGALAYFMFKEFFKDFKIITKKGDFDRYNYCANTYNAVRELRARLGGYIPLSNVESRDLINKNEENIKNTKVELLKIAIKAKKIKFPAEQTELADELGLVVF